MADDKKEEQKSQIQGEAESSPNHPNPLDCPECRAREQYYKDNPQLRPKQS